MALLIFANALLGGSARAGKAIVGTSGRDVLRGNESANKIYGGRSADRIYGGRRRRPRPRRHRA